MNKQELVDAVSAETGLTKQQAREAVEAVFSSIEGALRKGERVSLIGFGTFAVRESAARQGRNPNTGVRKFGAAKRRVLSTEKKLKEAASGGTDDPGPSITFTPSITVKGKVRG